MPAAPATEQKLTRKDFVAPLDVRWCPGCGDYAILNTIQKVFPTLGIPKENFVVVSGIGCSSRFPYYMNTYGFHTIHGRAPTVATGIKLANPELSVWMITGDGDGLSIGGNHLMHCLRRNIDITILLFNNRIYGLTKGQYSPTSDTGTVTKTSPLGSLEQPINPLCVAIASQATFVARTVDANPKHMTEIFAAAAKHKGTSFVEILQNCVIFNDKTWAAISDREVRDDRLVILQHGQPLIFGKEKRKGIRLNGLQPEVVTIGENGVTEDDILVHDEHDASPAYAYMLTQMSYPEFPTPMGVFRSTETSTTYNARMEEQITEAIAKAGRPNLTKELRGPEYWEVTADDVEAAAKGKGPKGADRTEEMDIMVEQLADQRNASRDPLTKALRLPIKTVIEHFVSVDVISVKPKSSINDAIKLLKEHGIGALPVISRKKLVGIITERDILMKVANKPIDRDTATVSSIMTPNPETLPITNTVGDAFNKLSNGHFRHLPIPEEDGKVGLISVKGLMGFLGEIAKK